MRRLFVGTTLVLFVLAIPGVVQAQRGRTGSGQSGSSHGGSGYSGSSHGGNRSGTSNGFSPQGYSSSFGSFGHNGNFGSATASLGGMGVYSQNSSRGFDSDDFSSPNANFAWGGSSSSSLGMGAHSLNPLGSTNSTTTAASGSSRSSYSSLGMGYQTGNSRGTNRANTNATSGSGGSSSSSLGMGTQSLNPLGTTNSTSTQQGSSTSATTQQNASTSPTPLQVLTGPPQTPSGNKAEIEVLVPTTIANVSIDGSPVNSNAGMTRYLQTPNLPPGSTYSYTVTVTWQNGAKTQTQSQLIQVTPGAVTVANFMQTGSTSN